MTRADRLGLPLGADKKSKALACHQAKKEDLGTHGGRSVDRTAFPDAAGHIGIMTGRLDRQRKL
jgi:hypothetical protein